MNATIRLRRPDALRALAAAALLLCVAIFLLESLRWPTIGDASLIHYAIFLMDRGAAPYRDIAEMNLPGTYFVEWAAIHSLGGGPLAWRFFDFLLMMAALAAMVTITLPLDWFAGLWAGALFLLIHGRDGLVQLGQRDLTASVCLIAGYSFLCLATRKNRPTLMLAFGLLTALAATIKPTVLPFAPLSLGLVYLQFRQQGLSSWKYLTSGVMGFMLPWLGTIVFLFKERAMGPFLHRIGGMLAYHASLGRHSVAYLLPHSVSPLLPLIAISLAAALIQRRRPGWNEGHLLIGAAVGLLSYLVQGKGYPYQRYPLLAFLLTAMALQFSTAVRETGVLRLVGVLGFAVGTLFLAPQSTALAGRYDGTNLGNIAMMEQDLRGLGEARLSGGVQCVDSITGCTDVLYRMRLPEVSMVFYDEFLFGPASEAAVVENRGKFWGDIQAHPPEVIVVTAPLFPNGPDNYQKLSRWPAFDVYLNQEYSVYLQRTPDVPVRWWARAEIPSGYRIYLRN